MAKEDNTDGHPTPSNFLIPRVKKNCQQYVITFDRLEKFFSEHKKWETKRGKQTQNISHYNGGKQTHPPTAQIVFLLTCIINKISTSHKQFLKQLIIKKVVSKNFPQFPTPKHPKQPPTHSNKQTHKKEQT